MIGAAGMIARVIEIEGGYSDRPEDLGGPTKYGITEAVARANGYSGEMIDLPRSFAESVYLEQYVSRPGFSSLIPISQRVAMEVIDTGINTGPGTAARMLQRALNALNRDQRDFPDMQVDGQIGPTSRASLTACLSRPRGEDMLMIALNVLQGARYIEIAEADESQELNLGGWLLQRVSLEGRAA